MSKKEKYYFLADYTCYNYQGIVAYAREHKLNSITVREAEKITGQGFFWCKLYQEAGFTGDSGCGTNCPDYQPRNGKNGRCKYSGYCYEPGEEVTFHNLLNEKTP